jgi:hypothetical protein
MPDERDLFRRSLAETIAWCSTRADPANPRESLRDPWLRPPQLSGFEGNDARRAAVTELVRRRAKHLYHPYGGFRFPLDAPATDLAGGRLLIYFPDENLFDGAAELSSKGFFDVANEPAWDTWVWFCSRDGADWQPAPVGGWSYPLGDSKGAGYDGFLVAWIPPAFLELVGWGIRVNPEACIVWAER